MKRWVCFLLAACLTALLVQASEARMNQLRSGEAVFHESAQADQTVAIPRKAFNNLHAGALWFPSVYNKGYLGYSDISAYYPGGGDQSILWQAGMLAAGYVEKEGGGFYSNAFRYLGLDGRNSDPASYDTIDQEAVPQDESNFGYPFPYRRLTIHVNSANKPLDPPDDPVDGDMGMEVTYQWHNWGARGYDNWVFCDVTIVFGKAINDFYWGWLSDCDCGDVNLPDYYFDDYAGWDEDLRFCYMRDWDYDALPNQPEASSTSDSLFMTPNVIGQVLIAAPPINGPVDAAPISDQKWISKNFWDWNNDISSVQNTFDRLAGIWENPFPPEDPFDYRILNGVGPYDVQAGDTAHFWLAYVVGEGYDDDTHATFGLGTLVEHVNDAQAFYDGGMVIPDEALGPKPVNLNADLGPIDDYVSADKLNLDWGPYSNLPAPAPQATNFRVYTSIVSQLGPWELVETLPGSATTTTVDLVPGFYTYVWVEAYNATDEVGANPYALTSRLFETDANGVLRANENTIVPAIGNLPAAEAMEDISVAPNPYIGSNLAELKEFETLLGFHNLPAKCTIYIYNLQGNIVDLIHHDADTGSEFWDMTTRSNEAISTGLYIYRVVGEFTTESGTTTAEKLGKFAVIKGQR
ncbi:MAG: hypothetical protein WAW06_06825 [bacterium]